MGRHEVGYVDDVTKTPIKGNGRQVAGCNFRASFRINKVGVRRTHVVSGVDQRWLNKRVHHTHSYACDIK